jgi:hypothetical protein
VDKLPFWCNDSITVHVRNFTVARSQHGLSANVGQKFGQMRKNSAFFQKYVFTAMHYIIRIKMASLEILSQKKFWWQLLIKDSKSRENSNFSCNIFFGRFCLKLAAVRPPNFPSQSFCYSAGFVLICRIFGRLATVVRIISGTKTPNFALPSCRVVELYSSQQHSQYIRTFLKTVHYSILSFRVHTYQYIR